MSHAYAPKTVNTKDNMTKIHTLVLIAETVGILKDRIYETWI